MLQLGPSRGWAAAGGAAREPSRSQGSAPELKTSQIRTVARTVGEKPPASAPTEKNQARADLPPFD